MLLNIHISNVNPPQDFRNSAREINRLYLYLKTVVEELGYEVPESGWLRVEVMEETETWKG